MSAGPTTMTPTESSKKSGCSVAEPRGGAANMLAVMAALGLAGIARRKRSQRN
jgi:MYXO-CTERM domain-containing protein